MSLERTIENPFYAKIFNHEGLIKMGTYWIKHTKDEIFIYPSEYINISLRNSIKPLHHVNMNLMVKDRSHDCETVYAWQNGNQWKKVTGKQGPHYNLQCINGFCEPVLSGLYTVESNSRKRGFLARWHAYDADRVGVGLTSENFFNENASSYSRLGLIGVQCYVTDGPTGTCNPF